MSSRRMSPSSNGNRAVAVLAGDVEVIDAGKLPRGTVQGLDLQHVLDLIEDGHSVPAIAEQIGIRARSLWDWVDRDPARREAVNASLVRSSHSYVRRAERVLEEAQGSPVEMVRARELAHHYRWMARVMLPRVYGDRVQVEHQHATLADALQALDAPAAPNPGASSHIPGSAERARTHRS